MGEHDACVLRRVGVRRRGRVQGGDPQRRVHGDRQGRRRPRPAAADRGVRRDCLSRDAPPPLDPARARVRAHPLREGRPARDDHAQPARGAERVRLQDAARARARVRGRELGRRHSRRRGHRRGTRVLRRRRPEELGAELLDNPRLYWKWFGAFKDMHDRLREIGKPTRRAHSGHRGRRRQRAADGAAISP